MFSFLSNEGLRTWLPNPPLALLLGVPVYTAILLTMAWRALARVQFSEVAIILFGTHLH